MKNAMWVRENIDAEMLGVRFSGNNIGRRPARGPSNNSPYLSVFLSSQSEGDMHNYFLL
jgi:hypothetical protein